MKNVNLHFVKENFIPKDASGIGIFDASNNLIGRIPVPKETNKEKLLYSVGLISDIHYNDMDESDNDPDTISKIDGEYHSDLGNALHYFKQKNVDFVCCVGDITTDNNPHLTNYKLHIDKYFSDMSIYSCIGNHDNMVIYNGDTKENINNWNKCASMFNDGLVKHYCSDGTSFYFIKENETDDDVFIFLNLDYGGDVSTPYANSTDNGVNDADRNHQYYSWESLYWFRDVLEQFKDKRCFVFTHLFFRHKSGNYNGNDYYNYYSAHTRRYTLRGEQCVFLNELNNTYKNSIWFSGHTHYIWKWQELDKNINICNQDREFIEGDGNTYPLKHIEFTGRTKECAYNIHIPSLSRPLKIDTNYSCDLYRSEGALMNVYETYIEIIGLTFKFDDGINEYKNVVVPLANYRIKI